METGPPVTVKLARSRVIIDLGKTRTGPVLLFESGGKSL
jgi:hypothetical protein